MSLVSVFEGQGASAGPRGTGGEALSEKAARPPEVYGGEAAGPRTRKGPGASGVWGRQPSHFSGGGTTAVSCPEPNYQKMNHQKGKHKQRRKMHKGKFSISTNQVLKRITPATLILTLTVQIALTGCAGIDRKEETVEDILAQENVLIEKVQAERALPGVQQGVSQSESLQAPEVHLEVALEEIKKANEIVTQKIFKQNEREVNFERHERIDR